MDFLEKADISKKIISQMEKLYDEELIANIIYKEEEVLEIIDYFKKLELDIESILLNRLDVFLLNLDYIKSKIDENQEVIENLKDDFSIFDELV